MIKESALVYRLSADNKRLATDLARAKGTLSNFRNQSKAITSQVRASFAGMFGVTAAIYGIARVSSNTIDLVKRLDSLDKALKAVTETDEKYAKAQIFLSKTAEEYGLEIEDLTRSYNKFIASSKGTALEGKQTEEIFRKVAKASAVMALSTDEVEGVLRALGQMMSKGKVQAEELRGQLGDRLPGAFNIMADSMGVTTAELDKMLKGGQVIADEVLPKFADQLLIAYGADKVGKIDTIVAAQNRLSNAWTEFVASVDKGDGVISKTLKNMYDGLARVLKGTLFEDRDDFDLGKVIGRNLAISNDELDKNIKMFSDKLQQMKDKITDIQKTINDPNVSVTTASKLSQIQEELNAQVLKYTGIILSLKSRQEDYNKSLDKGKNKTRDLAAEIAEATKKYKDLLDMFEISVSEPFQFDYESASQGLRGVPRDQMFTGEVSDMIGIDPEQVREYWEEINSVMSAGYFSLQETINSEGMRTYEAAFNTGLLLNDAIGGITDVISGMSSIKQVFARIFGMLADNMVQFGGALIAWGVAVKSLKSSFKNPAAAIGAGIALVAAGTALKAAVANAKSDFGSDGGGGVSGPAGSFQNNFLGQSDLKPKPIMVKFENGSLTGLLEYENNRNARLRGNG